MMTLAAIERFCEDAGLSGDIEFRISAAVFRELAACTENSTPSTIYLRYSEGRITLHRRPTVEERLASLESEVWKRP